MGTVSQLLRVFIPLGGAACKSVCLHCVAMAMYGRLTVPALKKELAQRGAKTSGRKAELVERLEAYDRNDNFGTENAGIIVDLFDSEMLLNTKQ